MFLVAAIRRMVIGGGQGGRRLVSEQALTANLIQYTLLWLRNDFYLIICIGGYYDSLKSWLCDAVFDAYLV